MLNWLKNAFRFDGIQDDEIPSNSDWQWLTPMERIGVQTQIDADIAKQIIEERKEKYLTIDQWKANLKR